MNLTNMKTLNIGGHDLVSLAIDGQQVWKLPAAFTNLLPTATDANGAIYNGVGWKQNIRISSSFAESTYTGMHVTGFIYVPAGATVRVKNVAVAGGNTAYVAEYTDAKGAATCHNAATKMGTPDENGVYTFKMNDYYNRYIRLSFAWINNSSIVTVDEEIPVDTETSRAVDVASVGYTANCRWSTSDGTIRTDATGIAAINEISFARKSGHTVRVKLQGLNWTYNTNCTLAGFANGAFVFGAYLNTAKWDGAIGYNIIHEGNGEVTLEFFDPGNSTAYAAADSFKVSGYGTGSNAIITICGEE